MFAGMTRTQVICCALGAVETLVGCTLLCAARTPTQVSVCLVATLCGFAAFAYSWEE